MNPILAGVALAVVTATIVAVSVRDARIATLSLAMVMLLGAVVADPVAAPVGLAARSVGAILAAYLLWIAARERTDDALPPAPTEGTRVGWPTEILLAAAAAVVGEAVVLLAAHPGGLVRGRPRLRHGGGGDEQRVAQGLAVKNAAHEGAAQGLGAPPLGPVEASVAGFAVAALAVAPVMTGRDVFRVGIGLILLLTAAELVGTGLVGTPEPLAQLVTTALLVTGAGTVATLALAARRDGPGGFTFATGAGDGSGSSRRAGRLQEAHPDPGRPRPEPTADDPARESSAELG